jgi:hypothetical protein
MKEKGSPDRSFQWCDPEFLEFGNYKLVYTTDENRNIVSIKTPGCGDINVHRLLSSVEKIKYPKKVRDTRERSPDVLTEHYNLKMGY